MEQTYAHVNDDIPASEKREYWETAFDLQAVDELKPSRYLRQLASEHIAGEKSYFQSQPHYYGPYLTPSSVIYYIHNAYYRRNQVCRRKSRQRIRY